LPVWALASSGVVGIGGLQVAVRRSVPGFKTSLSQGNQKRERKQIPYASTKLLQLVDMVS
jgi:hypothetical protein